MRTLRAWADKNNCDIVSIGHKNHFDNKSYLAAGPLQWLNLIQHAEVMVTNYYHGILLSIKNKTPLIPIYSKGKMAKIGDIAEKLDFKQFIHKDLSSKNISDLCINYNNIDSLLESHKSNSIEYLRSALSND
jgi:polysaccharide pyruvyl transferase WcaK-like protein